MAAGELEQQSVHDLQRLAAAGARPRRTKRRGVSRAARLHLVDRLSRWSAIGLASLAGISVYLGVTIGREFPVRATAWCALLLAALWACRTMRARYRSGEAIAARPFRWRANYTSALSVLGVAYGAAPVLLIPASAPPLMAVEIIGFTLLGALIAGGAHSAHRASAIAIASPALLFGFAALARSAVTGLPAAGVIAVAVFVAGFIGAATTMLLNDARRRFPRTGFVRSEVEGATALAATASADQNADAWRNTSAN